VTLSPSLRSLRRHRRTVVHYGRPLSLLPPPGPIHSFYTTSSPKKCHHDMVTESTPHSHSRANVQMHVGSGGTVYDSTKVAIDTLSLYTDHRVQGTLPRLFTPFECRPLLCCPFVSFISLSLCFECKCPLFVVVPQICALYIVPPHILALPPSFTPFVSLSLSLRVPVDSVIVALW